MVTHHRAMQLQHVFAASGLVKPVDVLRYDCFELAWFFQLSKLYVRRVRFYPRNKDFFTVKTVEFPRIWVQESVAQNFFRRIIPLLVVKPVHAAEIWNTALRWNSCSSEENDVRAFIYIILKSVRLFFRNAHIRLLFCMSWQKPFKPLSPVDKSQPASHVRRWWPATNVF